MSNFNMAITTPFHLEKIAVDIDSEMNLIKTGLLYADKLKLVSLSSWFLMFSYFTFDYGQNIRNKLMVNFSPETITNIKSRPLYQWKDSNRNCGEDIFLEFMDLVNRHARELIPAIEKDLLDFISVDVEGKFFGEGIFNKVIHKNIEEMLSGKSYPFYSNIASSGKVPHNDISNIKYEQVKHLQFVHLTLSNLPNFSNASISEILGIRDELEKYLVKFRAAMLKYSQGIKSMPWDKDFDGEVSLLFNSEIAPAVAEIKSIVEQNSFIRKFCTNIMNDKSATVVGGFGFGAAIAPLSEAIKISAMTAAGGAILGRNLINTYNEYLESSNRSKENALYFYYMAEQRSKR